MDDRDQIDIKATLNDDREAYGRLVRRYETQVSKLMWRFSQDPGMCEELVQEVFVEAYFSLKSYRGEAPFVHWLRRIGTRVGYRFWKNQAKEKSHFSLTDFDGIETEEGEDSIDAEAASRILHSLLGRLPQADRLVLTLMYFESWSTQEIADHMGWNRAMVKMRAYRARKKIKDIAEKEHLLEKIGWIP